MGWTRCLPHEIAACCVQVQAGDGQTGGDRDGERTTALKA